MELPPEGAQGAPGPIWPGDRLYLSNRKKQLRTAGLTLLFVLFLALAAGKDVLQWLKHGTPLSTDSELLAIGAAVFFLASLAVGALGVFGYPRLKVTAEGVTLDYGFRRTWAHWNSLGAFRMEEYSGNRVSFSYARAPVVGREASRISVEKGRFDIPDQFKRPLADILADFPARPPERGTADARSGNVTDFGVAGFRGPWVTWAILAVLVGVFVLEAVFALGGGKWASEFSVPTLLAMGGLNRVLVLEEGQWYRLFTAPLLHGGPIHLGLNGLVLVLVGRLLERMVGRVWFLALFVLGALGGALASLAFNAETLTSVGASGAIMGLCAAVIVAAFHLPSGPTRQRIHGLAARFLIPALLPLAVRDGGVQIDYAAHAGGAVAGALAAGLLLAVWPEERRLPPLKFGGAMIAMAGVMLTLFAAAAAVQGHPRFLPLAHLIPEEEMPRNNDEIERRAAGLLARYPDDPRAHLQRAIAYVRTHETTPAEKELRIGLALAEPHARYYWGNELIESLRGLLALALLDQDRKAEAKEVAAPICRAHLVPPDSGVGRVVFDYRLCD